MIKSWSVAGVMTLGLMVGISGGNLRAQQTAPSGSTATPRAYAPANFQRVAYQTVPPVPAPPGAVPPPPAVPAPPPAPDAAVPPPPGGMTEPLQSNTDLALPKSEKEGGGGEPTETQAAEEAAAAPAKDPTKLLMNLLGMEESKTKVYGWLQNSYTYNALGTPHNGLNFGVNPNNLANRWMGNQYYLIVERPLEQGDKISLGYRVDNLFGNDWLFNHMHGLNETTFKPNSFNGYDPAQFYAEIHLPGVISKGGTDIKGGRFYTILGYEVVPAVGRPLLSVPMMFNYGQPFTHFGMLATTHVNDQINWYNGTVNGYDRWVNANYKWGYLGGFTWTSKDTKASLAVSYTAGPNEYPSFPRASDPIYLFGTSPIGFMGGQKNPSYAGNWRFEATEVFSYKWTDTFTQVMESDQGHEPRVPGWGPNGTPATSDWYSFGNWFLWQMYKKDDRDILTGVWRSEWFRDVHGIRTGTGKTDNFFEMTVGMIYKPKPWLWVRPEARYDWAQWTHPYDDGTRNSQFTLGVDAILLY